MKQIVRLLGLAAFFWGLMPSYSQAQSTKAANKQLIVLLHGFVNNAASFDIMKEKLEKAFPAATVIALTSVEGMLSATLSIKEQAEASFKELESKVAHIDQKSIVLIGHSQGGTRAYALLKQYEQLLNIKGLVTLATPWEGVPGARVDTKMLAQYLTDPVLEDLRMLSLGFGYPADMFAQQLSISIQQNQNSCLFPGAKDLMVDSAFLGEIKKELLHEKVPLLAIGGTQNGFGSLLPKKGKHNFRALNSMYTFFIVGDSHLMNGHHDMQVPLYSQHALNIVPANKKNFKRVVIKDVFHGPYVWAKLRVPSGKDMLAHPDVCRKVIAFTKKVFA